MHYTFWHGKQNNASQWLEDALSALKNNEWNRPIYVDGSGWGDAASRREEAAIHLFQSMHSNTSAKCLVFQNAKLSSETQKSFTDAMLKNQGLRVVKIRNLSTEDGSYEVPSTLFANRRLETIEFSKVSLNTTSCQEMGKLIRDSTELRSVVLDNVQGIDRDGLQSILSNIILSSSLVSLKLRCLELDKACIKMIVDSLSANRSIQSLQLEAMNFDVNDVVEIARLIRSNRTIKELSLRRNNMGAGEFNVLVSHGLLQNETLQRLFLSRNPLEDASGEFLAKLIRCNSSLRTLCLVDTCLTEVGCNQVARALRSNSSLRSISLDGNKVENCAGAFLESLHSHNTTLHSIFDRMDSFLARHSAAPRAETHNWKEVDFYLRANKANRRLLYTDERSSNMAIDQSNLPFVLASTGTQSDVVFYFLQNTAYHFAVVAA